MEYRDALRIRMGSQLRIYGRTIGVIQLGYAFFFGWVASKQLSSVVQAEGTFKGVYFPAIDVVDLCYGILTALLTLVALIGGCGLICLRSWARAWEGAYLVLGFVLFVAVTVPQVLRGHEVGYIALFAAIFALPCLPLLWAAPWRREEAPRICRGG